MGEKEVYVYINLFFPSLRNHRNESDVPINETTKLGKKADITKF